MLCKQYVVDHVCLVSRIHGLKDMGRPGVGGSTRLIMGLMTSDRTTTNSGRGGLLNAVSPTTIACLGMSPKGRWDYIAWLDLYT
jgi:hypothetical protein